jgi:hypothetical protein
VIELASGRGADPSVARSRGAGEGGRRGCSPRRGPLAPAGAAADLRRRTLARLLGPLAIALAAAGLAGCAAPGGLRELAGGLSATQPAPHFGLLRLADQDFETEWHLPFSPRSSGKGLVAASAEPTAWLLLQHGFARRCANLRHLAATLARDAGVATLCLNAEMARGNAALAQALAQWLASDDARAPDGRPAPRRLIVGGHSAGGAFAAQVGAALAEQAPDRLAGALLFDPVGGAAMGRALMAVAAEGRRPVLALMAPASRCNAGQLGASALRSVQAALASESPPSAPTSASPQSEQAPGATAAPFVGLVFTAGTHVDAEGPDTGAVAVRACGEGWPQPAVVRAMGALAAAWAQDMAQAPARVPDAGASASERARVQARRVLGSDGAWRPIE